MSRSSRRLRWEASRGDARGHHARPRANPARDPPNALDLTHALSRRLGGKLPLKPECSARHGALEARGLQLPDSALSICVERRAGVMRAASAPAQCPGGRRRGGAGRRARDRRDARERRGDEDRGMPGRMAPTSFSMAPTLRRPGSWPSRCSASAGSCSSQAMTTHESSRGRAPLVSRSSTSCQRSISPSCRWAAAASSPGSRSP